MSTGTTDDKGREYESERCLLRAEAANSLRMSMQDRRLSDGMLPTAETQQRLPPVSHASARALMRRCLVTNMQYLGS